MEKNITIRRLNCRCYERCVVAIISAIAAMGRHFEAGSRS